MRFPPQQIGRQHPVAFPLFCKWPIAHSVVQKSVSTYVLFAGRVYKIENSVTAHNQKTFGSKQMITSISFSPTEDMRGLTKHFQKAFKFNKVPTLHFTEKADWYLWVVKRKMTQKTFFLLKWMREKEIQF